MHRPLLEVCVENLQSAQAAEQGGADRIELCNELKVGGLTPAEALIREVKKNLDIPIHVLIRPRIGDFFFSKHEFREMQNSISICQDLGVAGVVIGMLLPDGALDLDRTAELVAHARPLSVTFHRAFDEASNPLLAFEQIGAMKIDRLLTSGQQNTALAGQELIKDLIGMDVYKPLVMPGAGLRANNIERFASTVQAKEYHGSFSVFSNGIHFTRADTISSIIAILESL